jgi:hypothetical protein
MDGSRSPNRMGGAPFLSELAVTRVASMPMTSQSASVFPAISSHGNPAGVPSPVGRVPEYRCEVGQQGDVAHAGGPERGRGHQHEHGAPVEDGRAVLLPQRTAELLGQSDVADQPSTVGGDLQGMLPPVTLNGEERSRSVDYMVVVTSN